LVIYALVGFLLVVMETSPGLYLIYYNATHSSGQENIAQFDKKYTAKP